MWQFTLAIKYLEESWFVFLTLLLTLRMTLHFMYCNCIFFLIWSQMTFLILQFEGYSVLSLYVIVLKILYLWWCWFWCIANVCPYAPVLALLWMVQWCVVIWEHRGEPSIDGMTLILENLLRTMSGPASVGVLYAV